MTFPRLFFYLNLLGVLVYIWLALYAYHTRFSNRWAMNKKLQLLSNESGGPFEKRMRYILLWTSWDSEPFKRLLRGRSSFVHENCTYTNCFVTDDRSLLDDYAKFEAVMFNNAEFDEWLPQRLPGRRSPAQKYVFVSKQRADAKPVCEYVYDNYFNWTWTYRLDSDVVSPFIELVGKDGRVLGPRINTSLREEITAVRREIPSDLRRKLNSKSRAVAWIRSNCTTRRLHYVKSLEVSLAKLNLSLDALGRCSSANNDAQRSRELIANDYHFYLILADSVAEHFVTEETLAPLLHNAVPIIFEDDLNNNFFYPGSYLAVENRSSDKLATVIGEAVTNHSIYYKYFEWYNHVSYRKADGFAGTCDLCKLLNDDVETAKDTCYRDFRIWWHGSKDKFKHRCYPMSSLESRIIKWKTLLSVRTSLV